MATFPVKCMEEPAFGSQPTPTIPYKLKPTPTTPYKLNPRYWRGPEKGVLKSSSISYVASYNSCKILAIRLLYLYSEFGDHPLRHQGAAVS